MGVWRSSGQGADRTQNSEHRTQNTVTMDSRILLSATALVLLCLVDTGSSIKCHQCNSYDNFHCGDPFYFEDTPDEQKTQKFLAECHADGKEYFCRKIYQNVRGDERIIRGCGYEADPKGRDCYTTVLEEYNTEVCACCADCCGSGLPASLDHAVISTQTVPYPPELEQLHINQHQFQKLQIQQLQCSLETKTTNAAVLKLQQLRQQLQLQLQLLLC